jgi:hypothetical protein
MRQRHRHHDGKDGQDEHGAEPPRREDAPWGVVLVLLIRV